MNKSDFSHSEASAQLIDDEVRQLVEEGQRRATEILTANRGTLDALATTLNEKEVINGDEVKAIIAAHANNQ